MSIARQMLLQVAVGDIRRLTDIRTEADPLVSCDMQVGSLPADSARSVVLPLELPVSADGTASTRTIVRSQLMWQILTACAGDLACLSNPGGPL